MVGRMSAARIQAQNSMPNSEQTQTRNRARARTTNTNQTEKRCFVFGSSTPRELTYMHNVPVTMRTFDSKLKQTKSKEVETLAHYMRQARSATRKRPNRQGNRGTSFDQMRAPFGSSTPREFAYLNTVTPNLRVYDVKMQPSVEKRSQTTPAISTGPPPVPPRTVKHGTKSEESGSDSTSATYNAPTPHSDGSMNKYEKQYSSLKEKDFTGDTSLNFILNGGYGSEIGVEGEHERSICGTSLPDEMLEENEVILDVDLLSDKRLEVDASIGESPRKIVKETVDLSKCVTPNSEVSIIYERVDALPEKDDSEITEEMKIIVSDLDAALAADRSTPVIIEDFNNHQHVYSDDHVKDEIEREKSEIMKEDIKEDELLEDNMIIKAGIPVITEPKDSVNIDDAVVVHTSEKKESLSQLNASEVRIDTFTASKILTEEITEISFDNLAIDDIYKPVTGENERLEYASDINKEELSEHQVEKSEFSEGNETISQNLVDDELMVTPVSNNEDEIPKSPIETVRDFVPEEPIKSSGDEEKRSNDYIEIPEAELVVTTVSNDEDEILKAPIESVPDLGPEEPIKSSGDEEEKSNDTIEMPKTEFNPETQALVEERSDSLSSEKFSRVDIEIPDDELCFEKMKVFNERIPLAKDQDFLHTHESEKVDDFQGSNIEFGIQNIGLNPENKEIENEENKLPEAAYIYTEALYDNDNEDEKTEFEKSELKERNEQLASFTNISTNANNVSNENTGHTSFPVEKNEGNEDFVNEENENIELKENVLAASNVPDLADEQIGTEELGEPTKDAVDTIEGDNIVSYSYDETEFESLENQRRSPTRTPIDLVTVTDPHEAIGASIVVDRSERERVEDEMSSSLIRDSEECSSKLVEYVIAEALKETSDDSEIIYMKSSEILVEKCNDDDESILLCLQREREIEEDEASLSSEALNASNGDSVYCHTSESVIVKTDQDELKLPVDVDPRADSIGVKSLSTHSNLLEDEINY